MKIVIDIPDEDYEFIKDLRYVALARGNTKTIQKHIIDAIKQGKIYEGKQGEWIDIDSLVSKAICSKCQKPTITEPFGKPNYCPNCGSPMKKGGAE